MCRDMGDDRPADRNRRPYVRVLRDFPGEHGLGVRVVSESWYATLSHYDEQTRDWVRHATGSQPCAWCTLSPRRPRWTAWVFAIGHTDRRGVLIPLTEGAIKWCQPFEQLSKEGKLSGTDWQIRRKHGRKNGPLCMRMIDAPPMTFPFVKFPDLPTVVLSLFDRHAGLPGMEEPK